MEVGVTGWRGEDFDKLRGRDNWEENYPQCRDVGMCKDGTTAPGRITTLGCEFRSLSYQYCGADLDDRVLSI